MYEPMSKEVKRAYDKALENKRRKEQECKSVTEIKKPILQDHKKKQSKITQQDYLDTLKMIRSDKDLDQIQELFLSVISMYGLKTDEVAALLFSCMKSVLNEVVNKEFLANKFNIDITKLGGNELDGIQKIQKALLISFSEREKSNG